MNQILVCSVACIVMCLSGCGTTRITTDTTTETHIQDTLLTITSPTFEDELPVFKEIVATREETPETVFVAKKVKDGQVKAEIRYSPERNVMKVRIVPDDTTIGIARSITHISTKNKCEDRSLWSETNELIGKLVLLALLGIAILTILHHKSS